MFLTPDELRVLTGRQHADAQRAALDRMGLKYVLNADGRPKVSRAAVDALLGVRPTPVRKPSAPRLDLVR